MCTRPIRTRYPSHSDSLLTPPHPTPFEEKVCLLIWKHNETFHGFILQELFFCKELFENPNLCTCFFSILYPLSERDLISRTCLVGGYKSALFGQVNHYLYIPTSFQYRIEENF